MGHLGQAVVTQHLHPRDGGQRPVAVGELEDLVLLGMDVEVLRVRADLHLGAGGPGVPSACGAPVMQACPPGVQSPSWGPFSSPQSGGWQPGVAAPDPA